MFAAKCQYSPTAKREAFQRTAQTGRLVKLSPVISENCCPSARTGISANVANEARCLILDASQTSVDGCKVDDERSQSQEDGKEAGEAARGVFDTRTKRNC